ncbi:MAG: ComF family protein [Flavobacteriales bacterium]
MHLFKDILDLVYPKTCSSCGIALLDKENVICMQCVHELPKSEWHTQTDNPLTKLFWGRIPVFSAAAYYVFRQGGHVQRLLHQLKYRNMPEIGIKIGMLYGEDLADAPLFSTADYIVPVPLHKDKLKKRGYNQSACFGEGLVQVMRANLDTNLLIRTENTETQTRKSRYARWENVSDVFQVTDASRLYGKHILLVDDVITTGSTIEACAQTLLNSGVSKLSIASIAMPTH